MNAQRLRLIDHTLPIAANRDGGASGCTIRRAPEQEAGGLFIAGVIESLSLHGGTHVDAVRHFGGQGPGISDMPLACFHGPARLYDLRQGAAARCVIAVDDLARQGAPQAGEIALLATGWRDRHIGADREFFLTSPSLDPDACRWLAAHGVAAVGFDFAADAVTADVVAGTCDRALTAEDFPSHALLLTDGIALFENLCNLGAVVGLRAYFMGLPLPLPMADGSPVRAVSCLSPVL